MTDWIGRLASLKLAVGLLVVLLVALAAGTIVESAKGTETAGRTVYAAAWFHVLLVAFAVNVVASLMHLWPWGWRRTGFALTHGSLLLILAGALVTQLFKQEGHLPLWEGEASSVFLTDDGRSIPLGFSVRLESYEIDTYPGTQRPAMFRSRVVVDDPARGGTFPAVIQMNQELAHGGYRFFQSSYRIEQGREQTILSVARDPGQPIVFVGYVLLVAGMIVVLGTRIVQRRTIGPGLAAGFWVLAALTAQVPANAATVPDEATVDRLRSLPVQHDGRSMPLDTLAREAVWNVTGRSRLGGADPVATVLGWTFHNSEWALEPIVRVGSAELIQTCGVPAREGHASFLELVRNSCVIGLIKQARGAAERDEPRRGLASKAEKLEQRLVWMQRFFEREVLRVIPPGGDPLGAWLVPTPLGGPADLLALQETPPAGWPTRSEISRELAYNRVRPSRLAWWVLLASSVASIVAWNLRRRWLDALALLGLIGGFAVMTWGIATRWQVAGRIPASNMYESLLFLGWGVALFALVAVVFLRNRLVVLNAALMSTLTMVLADVLPIDPFVHPVPPVLAGTIWLAIHVPIIMLSYSVLALGVVVAHMQIGFEVFAPSRRDLVARMYDLLYWYILVGSILLIAGILTGSIWAASSWGRYWGWDPKEVWSLVAFLAYVGILHGKVDRWLGPFGVAAMSIVAFWTILMTYVGVNFVLSIGLHTYGFGSSAVVNWMLIVAVVEIVFLAVGAVFHRSRRDKQALPLIPLS